MVSASCAFIVFVKHVSVFVMENEQSTKVRWHNAEDGWLELE